MSDDQAITDDAQTAAISQLAAAVAALQSGEPVDVDSLTEAVSNAESPAAPKEPLEACTSCNHPTNCSRCDLPISHGGRALDGIINYHNPDGDGVCLRASDRKIVAFEKVGTGWKLVEPTTQEVANG